MKCCLCSHEFTPSPSYANKLSVRCRQCNKAYDRFYRLIAKRSKGTPITHEERQRIGDIVGIKFPPVSQKRSRYTLKDRIINGSTPEVNSGCWLWDGQIDRDGYGYMGLDGKRSVSAHRISYAAFKGTPTLPMICHKCDTRACVNPDHLFEGTALDNNKDMISKKRNVPASHSKNIGFPRYVTWCDTSKRFKVIFKRKYVGSFHTLGEATVVASRIKKTESSAKTS